ncbi:hypothetical protein [Treponema sp. R6D11]
MNNIERYHLAVNTVDSIFDDLDRSLQRAGALFGKPEEALYNLVFPEIKSVLGISIGGDLSGDYKEEGNGYTGEVRDIGLLLNSEDQPWTTIAEISEIAGKGNAKKIFKPGDYLIIPLSAREDKIDGVTFPAIEETGVKIVVTAVFDDKVIFNFENELFKAAMNSKNTNSGGFAKTAAAKYLNTRFLKTTLVHIEDYLLPNIDGLKVSLPTAYEVFGESEDGDWDDTVNWGEAVRHPYFEKCTNRIKVCVDDLNDTNWWRLSTPYAPSASGFCNTSSCGDAFCTIANDPWGGVAPAFCVGDNQHE